MSFGAQHGRAISRGECWNLRFVRSSISLFASASNHFACRLCGESDKIAGMSSAEILAELPRLKAEERRELFERLCDLQEQDLLSGAGPTGDEKRILDEALAEFDRDGNPGTPWRDVLQALRAGPRA